jgi:SAM-dependent methyltransferase
MPKSNHSQNPPDVDDLLWRHLKSVPAFRALLRSVEARLYQELEVEEPVLDLGCGDGHFVTMAFGAGLTAGIDPWWRPLQKAVRACVYRLPAQGLGDAMPFADQTFATVISNSVLEHIPDVQPVLNEAARVLQPGGRLIITFPSDDFTANLGGALWLERLRLKGLAQQYRRGFNFIARHAHTDPPERWHERLEKTNLVVEHWQPYFSVRALHALELGHFLGLPSFLCHLLTRRWILAPWRSSLYFTEKWLRPLFEERLAEGQTGTMLLYVARKPEAGEL